jgi:uncharacterized membrane protein
MTKSDSLIKKIAENSIIAAIYFVLTIAIAGISNMVKFNSELPSFWFLLCFWRPDFIFGVTLGCFLANFGSPMGLPDVFIGTAATLLSSLLVAYASPRMIVAIIYPVLANAFVVGAELQWLLAAPFWESVLYVGAGEAAVIVTSYILWLSLSHNKGFMHAINPTRHADIHW